MRQSIISIGLLFFAIGLMTACTADPLDTEEQKQKVETITTKSFSAMEPSDFFVTKEDLWSYIYFKSSTQDWNWVSNTTETRICFDPRKDVDVTAYPSEDKPSIYIVNYKNCWNNDLRNVDKDHIWGTFSKYPDNWEIISTDKRTLIVLAAGHGRFTMDSENTNLVGWVKDIAAEVEYLHTYSGDIKNAEDRYEFWNSIIFESERIKDIWQNLEGVYGFTLRDYLKEKYTKSGLTRSVAASDTSYHPVPGHYAYRYAVTYYDHTSSPHLTTTKWGEGYPYNQYCPIYTDTPASYAKAGSEAVAGGQIVYYMHYATDACPQVYSGAYCGAYLTNPINWDAMYQFNKSAASWANFQTSDSTRMAAVMLANIGTGMQLGYGLSYTSGELDDLQRVLNDEYELESYQVAFDDPDVNPYTEMITMIGQGIPSIVHSSGGQNNTNPYTFIVDGCVIGSHCVTTYYKFIPDVPDSQYDNIYAYGETTTPVMLYGMNWGNNGTDNDVFFASSEDWHVASGDHSNREALLSFRMDGSQPGD